MPRRPLRDDELFSTLVGSAPSRGRRIAPGLGLSLATHTVIVAAAILLPVLWPGALPGQPVDYVRVLVYDPPPPPPLPLPKGNPMLPEQVQRRRPRPQRSTPTPETSERAPEVTVMPSLTLPQELTPPELSDEQWGSDAGSDFGVPEGMEGGVPGGQVGGLPGGVIGGVVGGRLGGILPVQDYDRSPRLLHSTKPRYPQEAFLKKVEGTVLLEILIDTDGRVAHARVLRSVPMLDAAALAAVKLWLFEPALKNGHRVPTLARAPIRFTIY